MKTEGSNSWKIPALSLMVLCLATSHLPGQCGDLQITCGPALRIYIDAQSVGKSDAAEEIKSNVPKGEVYEVQTGKKAELKRKERIRLASRKIRVAFIKLSDPRDIADSIEHQIKIIRKMDDTIMDEFNGEGGFYEFFVDLEPAQYTVKYYVKVKIKNKYYQERLKQLHRGKIRKAWSEIVVDQSINIKNKPGT
jgi:hypothetical protein